MHIYFNVQNLILKDESLLYLKKFLHAICNFLHDIMYTLIEKSIDIKIGHFGFGAKFTLLKSHLMKTTETTKVDFIIEPQIYFDHMKPIL